MTDTQAALIVFVPIGIGIIAIVHQLVHDPKAVKRFSEAMERFSIKTWIQIGDQKLLHESYTN